MLDYWLLVTRRAAWESWTTITGLETVFQIAVFIGPTVATALFYLWREGRDVLKNEVLRPLAFIAAGNIVCAAGLFVWKLAEMPVVVQRETEAAAAGFMVEHQKRDRESRGDVVLMDPEARKAVRDAQSQEAETLKQQLREAQGQLDNRKQIEDVRKKLGDLVAQGDALRRQCNSIAPAEYKPKTELWVNDGVRILSEGGFQSQAQRLRNMTPPAGIPRLATPNCQPYQENSKTAFGVLVLLYLIDDISNRLGS